MKAIESRLKPYCGLGKIHTQRANPSVFHKDCTIVYKFCSDSAYAEFRQNTYNCNNDENVHYQIGTSFKEKFYDEAMLHFLEQKFNLDSSFETIVLSKGMLGIVRSIDLTNNITKLKNAIDVKLVRNEVHLGCNPSLDEWSSEWVSMFTGESFDERNECYFRLNVKYLKLGLNHGYKYTKICYSGVDKQILFYGYDHYSNFQDQHFRMLVMPIKTSF